MISLIDFEKDLIIPRKEAEKLNLPYKDDIKIGYRHNELQLMGSFDHYKEDCIKKSIDKEEVYFKSKDDEKPIEDYYLYEKVNNDIDYVFVQSKNHLVSLLDFAPKCKYKFFVRESVITNEVSTEHLELILAKLEEKVQIIANVSNKVIDNTFNKRINVHVGGGLITTYNDLLLKEDACTDVLQQELNNGWRIIAVCVQPNQRRPDYILGRYNDKIKVEDKTSAER